MTAAATRLTPDDRIEIEDLVKDHAWFADHGEEPRMAELYTEDGRLLGVEAEPIAGRAAIAAWGAARAGIGRTVRHVITNLRLQALGEGAAGQAILTLYRHDGPGKGRAIPLLVADCTDQYVRTAEGWRIAERRIDWIFLTPPDA